MSGFTEAALEKKLTELNNSQQSIQTLSLWLIHHRKHFKLIVKVWLKELIKAKQTRRLTFMYLANDVIQNSKKKGPEYTSEFSTALKKAFHHVSHGADDKTKKGLEKILKVWGDRNIYSAAVLENFREGITGTVRTVESAPPPKKKKKIEHIPAPTIKEDHNDTPKSPPGEPPEAEELIKALQDLENTASSDAYVREKIANLPPEVSDISLLDRIEDKSNAEQLSKQVEDACALLADYNGRLTLELENRKQVARMLINFTLSQRESLINAEKKLEEYRDRLYKVTQVRNELKSHLQNLPDLTRLPNVTGGLAPLPSAGDLFSQH